MAKKVTKSLDEFLNDNDIRIGPGDKISVSPPIYYRSLIEGFYDYYKTYQDNRDQYPLYLDLNGPGPENADWFEGISNSTSIILNFHRFFELLIKDLLRKSDPFLAVKFLEKTQEVIDFSSGELNAENVKTVEFSEAYRRFRLAIKKYGQNSKMSKFEEINKFSFLENEGLEKINEWRNRIMHNGTRLPNIYALDYVTTQIVVPIISNILAQEEQRVIYHMKSMFTTKTEIDLLEEFGKIKFDYKDFYKADKKDLMNKLWRIGHIKEFGRANYRFKKKFTFGGDQLWAYSYYRNPFDQAKRFAESEKNTNANGCIDILTCPCCGVESLCLYKQVRILFPGDTTSRKYFYWVNCQACTYSIRDNIGDPNLLGFSKLPIFPAS